MVFGFSDTKMCSPDFVLGCCALPTTDTSLWRPAHISQVCLGELGGWADVGAVLGGARLAGGFWMCWDELDEPLLPCTFYSQGL